MGAVQAEPMAEAAEEEATAVDVTAARRAVGPLVVASVVASGVAEDVPAAEPLAAAMAAETAAAAPAAVAAVVAPTVVRQVAHLAVLVVGVAAAATKEVAGRAAAEQTAGDATDMATPAVAQMEAAEEVLLAEQRVEATRAVV